MPFSQRVWLLFGSLSPSKFGDEISSFADLGCLSWKLDPKSEFFPSWVIDPGSKFFPSQIPDPNFSHHWWKKEFKYFNPKKWFQRSKKYDSGFSSWILILTFYSSQIPILDPRSWIQGSKRHRIPDPGSLIWIHITGDFGFAMAVGGSVGYWLSTGAAVLTTHSMDQLSEAFLCKKEFSVYSI